MYTAGALAWNIERNDEALKLLYEGINRNPKYWKFRLYIAGIVYKQAGKYKEMVKVLEEAITYSDCPNIVKSILASIYEYEDRYVDALKLWINIYDTNDPIYEIKAKDKIDKLSKKIGIKT